MSAAHDKAVELVEKFKPLVTLWDCYNDSPQDEIFVIKDAKQCALIAVNEVLHVLLNSDEDSDLMFVYEINLYEKIKEEITNLK
jgi:hypothetical protein